MPVKPVRYKTWFAGLVVATVGLGLTSSDAIVRVPDKNSHTAAGTDSISAAVSAGRAADSPVSADHPANVAATTAVVDIALLPSVDQAIYYWVGRTRNLVRGYWPETLEWPDAQLN